MTPIYGHDQAIDAFREGVSRGRLHHAWLITGPVGIGKALFAHMAALWVVAEGQRPMGLGGFEVPEDHPAAYLVAAGSHPDLMKLERLPNEKKPDELLRGINIAQVRALHRLFDTTSTFSPWRIVVIDAVDDLEVGAMNALLKNLEEPPPFTIFLLVSHIPAGLPATIRSRCRQLPLSSLDDDAMTSALRAALPDATDSEIEDLKAISDGSPGRAIAFRGLDIAALDKAMNDLATLGDPTNSRRSQLAQTLSLKSAQPRYEAFLARAPSLIAAQAKQRRGGALAEALRLWERAQSLASSATPLSLEPQSVVFELGGILATLASPPGSKE